MRFFLSIKAKSVIMHALEMGAGCKGCSGDENSCAGLFLVFFLISLSVIRLSFLQPNLFIGVGNKYGFKANKSVSK